MNYFKIVFLFIYFIFLSEKYLCSEIDLSGSLLVSKNISGPVNMTYHAPLEKKGIIAWQSFLEPFNNSLDDGAILLNFVNADIINVLKYYEELYKVIFITDDVLQPISPQGKSLFGSKINFTSHKPLSKKDAWNVLITLLEIVGVTLQPGTMNRVYRVVTLMKESSQSYARGPLPTFIGVPSESLPDSDMRIRYLYQVQNMSIDGVLNIIKNMQSNVSPDPIAIREMNSILLTDRVYNIKVILAIIHELDKMMVPEKMVIIKLKKGNASTIVDLYKSLVKEEASGQIPPRIAGIKRTDMVTYFDPQVRLIAEQRMNYIIAFGSEESLRRVESFILNFQDAIPTMPYMPIHTYLLKYTQADAVANILKQAIGFKSDAEAAKYSGVRDSEKYLSDVSILPEPNTNSLLITCSDENYQHIYDLLQKVDIEQKQVAVNITIVSVDLEEMKSFGTQLRNKIDALGKDINFQTGTLDSKVGVVGNYPKGVTGEATGGPQRLLGNLLQLVTGATVSGGTTVVSLGSDPNGVWGLIKLLVTQTKAKIISNPYLVMTNKYPTEISVGETRRIAATSITNANNEQMSYTSDAAELSIKMTVNIQGNDVGINLDLSNSIFTGPENNAIASGNKTTRSLNTSVLVENESMVAVGGLIIDHTTQYANQVPFLSQIPIIQWLFKSQDMVTRKSMLIIFIEPTILHSENDLAHNTQHLCEKISSMHKNHKIATNCPLGRSFFQENSYMKMENYFGNNEIGSALFSSLEKSMCDLKQKHRSKVMAIDQELSCSVENKYSLKKERVKKNKRKFLSVRQRKC